MVQATMPQSDSYSYDSALGPLSFKGFQKPPQASRLITSLCALEYIDQEYSCRFMISISINSYRIHFLGMNKNQIELHWKQTTYHTFPDLKPKNERLNKSLGYKVPDPSSTNTWLLYIYTCIIKGSLEVLTSDYTESCR